MRKILFVGILSAYSFCADIAWMSLDAAKIAAKKENKIVMVEVSSHSCRYCVDMANTTFKNDAIVEKINKNFASVLFYQDSDVVPAEFASRGTPTFFFVDKNGKRLSPPIFGAWNAGDFNFFLDKAIQKAKEQK